jgi:hypothetical protein
VHYQAVPRCAAQWPRDKRAGLFDPSIYVIGPFGFWSGAFWFRPVTNGELFTLELTGTPRHIRIGTANPTV